MLLIQAVVVAAALTLPRHAVFGAAVADRPAGLTVSRIVPNSAAAAAGIEPGDVIARVDGVATPNTPAFLAEIHTLRAGATVTATIVRNGAPREITVTLGKPADERDPAVTTVYGAINVDGSLRRTLTTLPAGTTAPRPGVLFIGGIGCFSVDVAADPQDPYLRLAHDLSRAGFVTMRLEKSGVGDSQGPACRGVDFAGEERSYAAALAALRADRHVDSRRVFLFGHSIGTIVAPRLARRERVAGVIVAEAVGRDWLEYELHNTRRQLELGGSSPSQTDAALVEKYGCMYRLLIEKKSEANIEAEMPSCKEHNGVYPVDAAYVQEVAAVNVIEAWASLDVPVLAIYGSSDFVTEEGDHQRIVSVVNTGHSGLATFRKINGMDHLLYRAPDQKSAMEAFDKGAPREYDTELSNVVIKWLKSRPT
jgi:pimeloyl-ACP methyl ester carboxylesterase